MPRIVVEKENKLSRQTLGICISNTIEFGETTTFRRTYELPKNSFWPTKWIQFMHIAQKRPTVRFFSSARLVPERKKSENCGAE